MTIPSRPTPTPLQGTSATYRALKKKSNQVAIGRKGRKNCLVTGTNKDAMSIVAAKVFMSGPGD